MRRLPVWWFGAAFAAIAYCAIVVGFPDHRPPGIRMVFELDLDALREARSAETVQSLEAALVGDHIAGNVTARPPDRIELRLDDPTRLTDVERDVAGSLTRAPCMVQATACYHAPDLDHAEVRRLLDTALTTTRDRLGEKATSTAVFFDGDALAVELFEPDPDTIAEIRDLITRTAKLEMKVVDDCDGSAPRCTAAVATHDGSGFVKRVFAHVHDGDPAATAAGITAEVDTWRGEDNVRHTDYYLRAADREEDVSPDEAKRLGCFRAPRCLVTGRRVIERYLAALAASDPIYATPGDREIGFERADPPPDAKDKRPFWRTYYLEVLPRVTGGAIAKALPTYDPNTNRPMVILELNKRAATSFGELTAEITGMKLATILNGTIKSAPIVNGAIRGGRVQIAMGGSDVTRAERERNDLVAVLNAGSGPPLRQASARELAELTGVSWPKLVPGLIVLLGLVGFAVLRRRAA